MAEETINTPAPEHTESRAQERIIQLSDKVRQEAEARTVAEARATVAERKAAFAEGFADIMSTNPSAKEHKADIQAKVDAGLTVEDATYAVLGKAGKLGAAAVTPSPTPTPAAQVAGGSSPTNVSQSPKTAGEMTQAERRAQLEKDLLWQ